MIKKWLIGILIAVVIIAGGWGYYSNRSARPIKVKTAEVEKKDLEQVVSGSGVIQADRQVDLLPPAAGEITKIYVKEGDVVEEDDDLLKLKNTGKLESSIDGTVVQLNAAVGQTAVPGQPLAIIADLDPTYFTANIDESDIAKVSPGQQVRIVLDAYPDETLSGEVVEIGLLSQSVAAGGTAFPVKIRLTDNKGVTLRLGMNGDTDIIVGTKKAALAIPLNAVTTREGKDIAFQVKNKKIKKREVGLGQATDDFYEVTKGLNAGDKVVINNLAKLEGGEKVK
jgi:multidrug efflux pump subunit AcrA (membrane-fusion protein)